MNRRRFIYLCGGTCVVALGASLFSGCGAVYYATCVETNKYVQINKTEFIFMRNKKQTFRKSVLVKVNGLNYPIVVYRHNENEYTALLLKCTHQGNELTVHGNMLVCSAHGSEFNSSGEVVTGPAEKTLHKFPMSFNGQNIRIHIS